MEVNKETIGSFQLWQSLKLWQSPYWKRECSDVKTVRATRADREKTKNERTMNEE